MNHTNDLNQLLISSGYTAVPIRLHIAGAGQLLSEAKINQVPGLYILDTSRLNILNHNLNLILRSQA